MQLVAYHIQMYKSVRDSGWIEVVPLTVLVGKNEAGKTTLLRALHKFNPYKPEPYNMDREWPRGHRRDRSDAQVVCTARFSLSATEIADLSAITDQQMTATTVEISRDYAGRFEVLFPNNLFPDKLHPNDIDQLCAALPTPSEPVGEQFRAVVSQCVQETRRIAHEGRFTDLTALRDDQNRQLQAAYTPGQQQPQFQHEQTFTTQYATSLQQIINQAQQLPSIQTRAHEYIIKHLPIFIYMDDYRAFTGTARLDQVQQRKTQPTEEDKTLLMIMELSGLDLDEEVRKGNQPDREQRQYDLDDAGATLTNEIEGRWKQRKYEVHFGADGPQFFTFVKDQQDRALIRLEERSKGFQWFFSFDLLFMYESKGTFKNCVILLDEPGLHLHPEAQRNLLTRMEHYATDNTLIYTSHLPFMIDLRQPDRIRIISETPLGTIVTDDLTKTQPEAKLTLQAALGITGSTSFLLAQRNLIVEGVDDYWIITELSNLLIRAGQVGLSDDIMITASGGASEAAYIATLMVGQELEVVVLLDTDTAGDHARDDLVKKWLTRYKTNPANVLSLGPASGESARTFAIEDLFPDDFYLKFVYEAYSKQLQNVGTSQLTLQGTDQLCKRVERALEALQIPFNKGSVAKRLRSALSKMRDVTDLPSITKTRAQKLVATIAGAYRV